MKTYNDIKHLNYYDVAFFKGISPMEAKLEICYKLWGNDAKFTAKGNPKISISDTIEKEEIDFTMKSNSELDGYDKMKYLCDYYNSGCDLNYLRLYGENKTFIRKLKFTGKEGILNEIMNPDQYLKLQKIWLFGNVYGKTKFSKEANDFIEKHKWTQQYLESVGIYKTETA